jgi:chemotaxis protein CheD
MFECKGESIGDRNVAAVKKELLLLKIRLIAEDTGANYGRTLSFNPTSGLMSVKSVGKPEKTF